MAEYFQDNPRIIVNGFLHSGISDALDGTEDGLEDHPTDIETMDLDEELDNEEEVVVLDEEAVEIVM